MLCSTPSSPLCRTPSRCSPKLDATYPVVAYPGQQEGGEEALEETIYAGLVFP